MLRFLFFAGLLLAMLPLSAQEPTKPDGDSAIEYREMAEEMPAILNKGHNGDYMSFFSKNLVYPRKAMEDGVQGRVVCRIRIGSTGKVDSIYVLNKVHPLLDAEAIRVLKLTEWSPGKVAGKRVPVELTVPVLFRLD